MFRGQLGGRPVWFRWRRLAAMVRPLIRRVRPFPYVRLTDVLVNGRRVGASPQYEHLFDRFPRALPHASFRGRVAAIGLESEPPSPWTDGWADVRYFPRAHVLLRDGDWLRPPASLVDRIERDLASVTRAPRRGRDSGFDRTWVIAVVVAGAGVLAAATLPRRSRGRRA
jgi:hypothetical protein